MLFDAGFLGTRALVYMDVVTLYFALLPFLLGGSILCAVKGKFRCHYVSQITILILTVAMVLIFEVGVRITGGFKEYVQYSDYSYDFLVLFLAVHILIALMAVGGWIYQMIWSYKAMKQGTHLSDSRHKRIGKWLFGAITLTSVMGCTIYVLLFV